MTNDAETVRQYFAKLGLEPEIADVYLALHAHGPQTISELSRTSGVERTHIYRLADDLVRSALVEIETQDKRSLYRAGPISNLRILVSRKEQELVSLKSELEVVERLLARDSLRSPASRVQFYSGAEGLKQLFWNQTRAHSEVLAILYENMQINTKQAFFDRWVNASNELRVSTRGIISDHFLDSQRAWYGNTRTARLNKWEARYVAPEVFPLTHSMVIYNDVSSYHIWKDDEIFGIEIYNQQIADSQRQFFELLWQQAKPLP